MASRLRVPAAFAFVMAAGTLLGSSAARAGFLEQLFGGAPEPAPQAPVYDYGQPAPAYRLAPIAPRPRRKVVAVDGKPKLQTPTDLMHDATLQNGDAVMTKSGLRIYTGDDGTNHHSKSDFDAVDEVDGVPKSQRAALIAVDTTRNDPLRHTLQPDTIASGRSAAVSVPIAPGRPIVDARGRTVRYVGP